MGKVGDTQYPPEQDGQRRARIDHRKPGRGMFRPKSEDRPERGQLDHPEKVRVALDTLPAVEDESMSLDQVAHVAEADEGVIAEEPARMRQEGKDEEPEYERRRTQCAGRQVVPTKDGETKHEGRRFNEAGPAPRGTNESPSPYRRTHGAADGASSMSHSTDEV